MAFASNDCGTLATCGLHSGCGAYSAWTNSWRRAIEDGREDVPWHVVAAILVLARFCEPSSELFIETTWYRRTVLDDLLGVAAEKVHTDRLYTGLTSARSRNI